MALTSVAGLSTLYALLSFCIIGSNTYTVKSAIVPVEGDLKLVGDGDDNRAGIVQVYSVLAGRQWVSICDPHFTVSDAKVVCRQLGYPPTKYWAADDLQIVRYAGTLDPGYNGTYQEPLDLWWQNASIAGPMSLTLNCRGNEASITLCEGYGWDPAVNATCLSGRSDAPPGTPGRPIGVRCMAPRNGTANAVNHPELATFVPGSGSAASRLPSGWLVPLLAALLSMCWLLAV